MRSRRSGSRFRWRVAPSRSTSPWRRESCSTRFCVGVDIVILAGVVLLGLCVGSFLNVCILRLPRDQSLIRPRSTCPNCKQPISKQYPLIESLVGVLFGASLLAYGMTWHAVAAALFGTLLLGIAITDARHYIIPDEFTWGGLVIGLLLALGGGVDGFLQALLGAAVGFVLLWLVGMAGTWVFKEEAMGGGDVKMMAIVGSFVGWDGVLLTVFAGAALGSLIFIPLSIKKKRLVPFGVFLAVGAVVAFVFGNAIIGWYGHFLKGD